MRACAPLPTPVPDFFFNDTSTAEIFTLSLHDALPILIWLCGVPSQLPPPADRMVSVRLPAPAVKDRVVPPSITYRTLPPGTDVAVAGTGVLAAGTGVFVLVAVGGIRGLVFVGGPWGMV